MRAAMAEASRNARTWAIEVPAYTTDGIRHKAAKEARESYETFMRDRGVSEMHYESVPRLLAPPWFKMDKEGPRIATSSGYMYPNSLDNWMVIFPRWAEHVRRYAARPSPPVIEHVPGGRSNLGDIWDSTRAFWG